MSVTIVLDGGIKTCCSVTSTEVVEKTVREWLGESEDLVIIDRQTETWEPDALARFAEQHFQEKTYPLVYIGDTLAMFGGIPNRKNLLAMAAGKMEYGIREKDILEAAKSMGQD
jgi:hypothetical protein